MTDSALTKEQAGLRRAALMGFVAGLRSQVPLASLARAVAQGEITAPSGPLGKTLRSKRGRQILLAASIGEAIVDKTPLASSRLKRSALLGRLGAGAIAAATLAQTQGTPVAGAAIRGAAGAGIGSVIGYLFRVVGVRVTGLPDLFIALAEDTIAVGLARTAIHPEAIAELAAERAETTASTASPTPKPDLSNADSPTSDLPGEGDSSAESQTAPIPSV